MNGIEDRVNRSEPQVIIEELANRLALVKTQPEEMPLILALCKAAWKKYPESHEVSFDPQLFWDNALEEAQSLLSSESNNEDLAVELADFSSSIIGGLYLLSIFKSFEVSER